VVLLLHAIKSLDYTISHVFREGGYSTDKLATLGFIAHNFSWWDNVHRVHLDDFARNNLGLRCFRFVYNEGFGFSPPYSLLYLAFFFNIFLRQFIAPFFAKKNNT